MTHLVKLSDRLRHAEPAEKPFCRNGETVKSLGEFQGDVSETSASLPPRGRVAVFCRSGYRFLTAMAAAWSRECTVILPPNAQPAMLAELAGEFDLLICDEDVDYDGAMLKLPVEKGQRAAGSVKLPKSEDCRLVFFTSGSTDKPKPVAKTLALLEREVMALEAVWGADGHAMEVTGLVSHQHIYGLLFRIVWPLMAGRLFQARMVDYWEELVGYEAQSALTVIASPAHLTRIPDGLSFRPARIFSSGGPLPQEASLAAGTVFKTTPVEVYGSTETGGIAYRSQQADKDVAWTVLPGVEVSVAEDDRLIVRSPHLGQEAPYLTEDQIRFSGENEFYLTGRVGKVVKVEGKRVSLAQVEHGLKGSALVADAAVFMLEGEDVGLAAIVVPSADGQALLNDIGAFRMGRKLRKELHSKQEGAGLPRRWRFVDRIPMNAQGKRPVKDLQAVFEQA